MHRVLVFGGRNYANRDAAFGALDLLLTVPDFKVGAIIEGGALGADRLGREWGNARGICVITVNANWDFYKKAAGAIRNGWMLDFCMPTYAVGFPGGSGTADMARKLNKAGVPLWHPYSV